MTWSARICVAAVLGATAIAAGGGGAQAPAPRLIGFTPSDAEAHLSRERQFMRLPSAAVAEQYFDVLAAEPHHTGSPYQIKLGQYVADLFTTFGMVATRYPYDVLIPWPRERRLELVAPVPQAIEVD
jgi:N-acetylated-alpha-linked acidic dipeptidase